MSKWMVKKIFTILHLKFVFILYYDCFSYLAGHNLGKHCWMTKRHVDQRSDCHTSGVAQLILKKRKFESSTIKNFTAHIYIS